MCGLKIPGKSRDDFFFAVDDHIHDKGQFRGFCGVKHILVDGVAVQNSGPGKWTHDEFGTMIRQYGFAGGDPRKHAFAPAGKTGEKGRQLSCFSDQAGADRSHIPQLLLFAL